MELKLDREDANLLADGEENLNAEQLARLTALRSGLDALLATKVECPGDGNGDFLVDQTDLDEWEYWAAPERHHCRRLGIRSEEHTSELQSRPHLGCRLLLEKKNGGIQY